MSEHMTIEQCSLQYDNLLRKIDSVQAEISLLRDGPSANSEKCVKRIDELENTILRLSQDAADLYMLLAHSIAQVVDKKYRGILTDFSLKKKCRLDIATTYGYNYYYLCYLLSTLSRQPMDHGDGICDGKNVS